MNFATTVRIVLAINVVIAYSQAQRYEGSSCRLHDGSQGNCKNYVDCKWLKESLEMDKLKYNDIVECSFQGDRRIVCCAESRTADEPPQPLDPDRNQPIDETMPITNGIGVELGEFPWMAALGYRNNDNNTTRYSCGGTIISEFFVLTAAHCAPTEAAPYIVRLGKVTLRTDDDGAIPIDIKIQEIILHPQYDSTKKKNDIALIRLAEPIKFTSYIRPAFIRSNLDDVLPNDDDEPELFITGWGSIRPFPTVLSPKLLKTNVISMPLELCNKTLIDINRQADEPALRNGLSSSQYCAFDPMAKSDACAGDSGGPLQVFLDQPNIAWIVGIISFGVSCATKAPGVYTRVASYIDWILPIVWPNL